MFFYKIDNQKRIQEYIEFQQNEIVPPFILNGNYLKTERKIITDADGNHVFTDTIDIQADNLKKAERAFAEAKKIRIAEAHTTFEAKRDAVIWVPTSLGLYGFDTKEADRINFNDAWKAAEINGSTGYRVWLKQGTDKKGWREGFVVADFNKIFENGRKQQIAAYAWFEEIKTKIETAETAEALKAIEVK